MNERDYSALFSDLEQESRALCIMLYEQDASVWRRPTPAEGWSVLDQVTHLAHFDEQAVLATTDPEGFLESRAGFVADVDAATARVAETYRSWSGPQVLRWFSHARAGLVNSFAGIAPSTRVPWYGPDMSAASAVTARLMETWAHGQDIADALGVDRLPSSSLRHVADLGVRTRANGFRAHGRVVPSPEVRVELTSPNGQLWTWGPEDAHDCVAGPALDFCLVVTQRRHRADTRLRARGPVADEWLDVAQAYAGPPGAKRAPVSPVVRGACRTAAPAVREAGKL